jgi:hypothetical protein
MNFRVVWLSGIVAGTAGAAACEAPDPGEITFVERQSADPTSSSSGGSSGGSSGAATDGGGSSGADAGKDPVFSVAFSPGKPGQNANDVMEHPAAEKPLEGKNCFKAGGCHAENNHKWGFAGTVYSAITGGTTVKNAQVVVAKADWTDFASVYTDDQGNFWYEGAKPPANARAGVRDATKSKTMSAIVAGDPGGQCNSGGCHGITSMRIYLQ